MNVLVTENNYCATTCTVQQK